MLIMMGGPESPPKPPEILLTERVITMGPQPPEILLTERVITMGPPKPPEVRAGGLIRAGTSGPTSPTSSTGSRCRV
jgi:hypothetical protein